MVEDHHQYPQQDVQPNTSHTIWQSSAASVLGIATIVIGVAYLFISTTHKRVECSLPDRPTIAVMPFTNTSGDGELEELTNGMSEKLTIPLSGKPILIVKDPDYVLPNKVNTVKDRQLVEELCVHYLVEGSVRRVGSQVRVNVQLIDVATRDRLWAERYEGSLDDEFPNLDEITRQIVTTLTESKVLSGH